MRTLPIAFIAAATLAAAAHAQGTTSTTYQLGKRDAAVTEPFSEISGVAELSDGRAMASDRIEKLFYVLDLKTGARRPFGRNGAGPNEYQTPFGPIRWKGDTLLGHDPNNRRALRILPDGKIDGMYPFAPPRPGGVNGWGLAKAVDAQGRIYWDLPIIDMQPVIKRSVKANLVRWLPGSDSIEVVQTFADHADFEHELRYRAYPLGDTWVLGADGRVGIVSGAEYRLRWYRDGKVVETGPLLGYTPQQVTDAVREAFWNKKALEPAAAGSVGGAPTPGGQMGYERAKKSWPDSLFPAKLPPFEPGAAMITPGGDIWVKRLVPTAPAPRYDILDGKGALRGVLNLPPKSRIILLGKSGVWLATTDDDGFQKLERYAYPAGLR